MPYSRTAIITFLDGNGGLSPDQGLPAPPVYPGQGLPGAPPYPSQGLPPGAVQLPVFPFDPTRPDNSLPGAPGSPDNSLPGSGGPSTQPIIPGKRFIVKWLACQGLILVPDNSLPGSPAEPK
jgi:hypothetical protein